MALVLLMQCSIGAGCAVWTLVCLRCPGADDACLSADVLALMTRVCRCPGADDARMSLSWR